MQRVLNKTKISIEKIFRIEINRPKPSIINEAVNLEKRAIFIAIPKTGTTTVRTQLSQEGNPIIPNPHLNIVQVRELIYIHTLKDELGENTIFPNESILDDSSLRRKATETFNTCFKFSAVRNPWARAVSLSFRREGVQVREKITFEKFYEKHLYASDTCYHPTLHKYQYDWLCDERGEILMDYVYKVEEFENAIQEIEKRTNGQLKLINVNQNDNPNSQSNDYRKLYNNTQKIIGKRFEKDIDTFKYTF